jgi:hypothetical protein
MRRTVYILNKTGRWLHEHDEKQVMELIKWSKEQLKSVIDTDVHLMITEKSGLYSRENYLILV